MKVKTMKILMFILTALLVISMSASVVYGLTPGEVEIPDDMGDAEQQISEFGGRIIGILQAVGAVLMVVILTVLGIKYMMGSAEEKAEYKKTMIPYVIGAVCIFMAPTIANVVYNFVKQ